MVSLAILETIDPSLGSLIEETKTLQNTALWFPDVPESHLHLNETYLAGPATHPSEFQPLCYILFSGFGTTKPPYLTKISVLSQADSIMMIDFHYNNGDIRRLGCQYHETSRYDTADFLIDSVHGEFIKSVEADLYFKRWEGASKQGRLRSFKVLGPACFKQTYALITNLVFCRFLPTGDDMSISDIRKTHQSYLIR